MSLRFATIVLVSASLFLLFASREAPGADYPVITFEYGDLYDRFCSDALQRPIDPAAVAELATRLEALREQWRKEGPQLYGATVKVTGVPFRFREAKAALSLCNPGSLSFPLIINVQPYMRSLRGENALGLENFAGTLFHETLHRYVNDRRDSLPGKTTPLLVKYRAEPPPVRNHLHLLAIMDAVYRKLGRQKDLDKIVAFEETLSAAPHFRRTREIIAIEGIEKVICDIGKNGCGRRSDR